MSSLPSLSAIEFPGLLRDSTDPTRAIAALGGEHTVRTFVSCPAGDDGSSGLLTTTRLTLDLRTGKTGSKSNIISDPVRPTPNLFLLEITHLSNHESTPPIKTHARLVGRVTALTEFRSLADFHYHPPSNYVHPDGTPFSTLPHGGNLNTLADHVLDTLMRRPARQMPLDILLDRLRPARFARSAPERGAMNYWYKQYAFPQPLRSRESTIDEPTALTRLLPPATALALIPGHPLGDDGRSQPDRLDKLPHRVSYNCDMVPQAAHAVRPPVHRGKQAYTQLLTLLRKLFRRRPVWVRRALLLGVPPELRTGFKKAISVVSYSFQGSGPFIQACIRYGYDPRKDPQSRKYQVMEVRCGHPLVEAARLIQEQGQMEEDIPTKIVGLDDNEDEDGDEDEDEDEDMDEEELEVTGDVPMKVFKMPPEFVLNGIPKKRNNFFQICDMTLDPIVKAVKEEKVNKKYDQKDGFFTDNGIQRLQTVVKSTLFKMSKQVVGDDRAKEILRGDYRSISSLSARKRGRIQLRDVMKEGTRRTRSSTAARAKKVTPRRRSVAEVVDVLEEEREMEMDGDGIDALCNVAGNTLPVDNEHDGLGLGQLGNVQTGVMTFVQEAADAVTDTPDLGAEADDEGAMEEGGGASASGGTQKDDNHDDGVDDDNDDEDDDGDGEADGEDLFEVYESESDGVAEDDDDDVE